MVLNQVGPHSLGGVPSFLEREYGILTLGELPYVPSFWLQVEMTRSLQALSVEITDRRRFLTAYGEEALSFRTALESVVSSLLGTAAVPAGAEV